MTTSTRGTFSKKTEPEWIALKHLCVVWVQAQRPFNKIHARTIADDFDPDKFGRIAVTLPNGNGIYHIIDGQHRKGAIEMMGWSPDQKLPCEVYEAADPARAAELFDAINSSRKNPSPIDRFKIRVTAGRPEEVAVNKIARERGYTIESHKGAKTITCVQALLAVYRTQGPEVLDHTLRILQATWGMDSHAVEANIVRGYGSFMAEHERHANWGRLKDTMSKKYTPGRLLGAAKSAREVHGGSTAEAIKQLITSTYNRGLPKSKHLRGEPDGDE